MQYAVPEEKRERISKATGWCMVGTAAFIDLLEILFTALAIGLVLNPIISICADLGFWIWFKMHSVSFIKKPKNLAAMGIQGIVGLIPGLDALPELTLGVLVLVKLTQSEDRGVFWEKPLARRTHKWLRGKLKLSRG